MDVLIIDNYDSFTYNIVQYVEQAGGKVSLMKNNAIDIDVAKSFSRILLSPGANTPEKSGQMDDVILHCHKRSRILGICLGHQAIAIHFGGNISNLSKPLHGYQDKAKRVAPHFLFHEMPDTFKIGHYHSWIVSTEDLPEEFTITAIDNMGNIMAFKHNTYDIHGVQFHPESVMTPLGNKIIYNWLYSF